MKRIKKIRPVWIVEYRATAGDKRWYVVGEFFYVLRKEAEVAARMERKRIGPPIRVARYERTVPVF